MESIKTCSIKGTPIEAKMSEPLVIQTYATTVAEGGNGSAEAVTTTGEGDTNTIMLAGDTVAMPGRQADKAAVENKIPTISHKRF